MRWILLRFAAVGLFASVAVGLNSSFAAAAGVVSPWASQDVHLVASADIDNPQQLGEVQTCNGGKVAQIRVRSGSVSTYLACVFGEVGEVRVARFYNPYSGRAYAVSFRTDTDFYPMRGICGGMNGCSYAPKTNTFLVQQYVGHWQKVAGIYRDFTQKLKAGSDPLTGAVWYDFIPDGLPTYFEVGTLPLSIESAAFSGNGEWLALEMMTLGILRVNVRTLEARRVVAPGSVYGLGSDPLVELAISNDGSSVAVMGSRKGLRVTAVDETCGDKVTTQTVQYYGADTVACTDSPVNPYALFHAFYQASYPSFSADGKQLFLTAMSLYGVYSRAVLSPEQGTNQGLYSYIALGDSYTSGEGETNSGAYLPYTDTSPHSCHVSERSYPFVATALWDVAGISVACSGATTTDIAGGDTYLGQGSRLSGLSGGQLEAIQKSAIESGRQGIVRQLEFVKRYKPAFVTLGIGGNDAGFMDKLKTCVGVGTCEWAKESSLRTSVGLEIQAVRSKIEATIKAIKEVSPRSSIALVGYPEVINALDDCSGLTGTLLNKQERVFMQQAMRLLNAVLASVASQEGEHYIDLQDVYSGAMLCDKNPRAMNGVRFGDDSALIASLPKVKVIGAESFHPTPYGHQLAAQRILTQFPVFANISNCRCANTTPQAAPSDYWGESNGTNDGVRRLIRQEPDSAAHKAGSTIEVAVQEGVFLPNTKVQIEIHSEPTLLKEVEVGVDGSLAARIELPEDIVDGYHTVHVLGTDIAYQDVDVYHSVYVGEVVETQAVGTTQPAASPIIADKKSVPLRTGGPSDSRFGIPDSGRTEESAVLGVADMLVASNMKKPNSMQKVTTPAVTHEVPMLGQLLSLAPYVSILFVCAASYWWLWLKSRRGKK